MAFAARSSLAAGLSRHLARRLHPSLSHLLTRHEDPSSSSPAPPPPTQQQPIPPFLFSDDLRRRSRSQTLALPIPFGAHRSFSTSSPGPEADAAAGVLSDDGAGGGMGMDAAAGVLSDAARPLSVASIASFAADRFPPVAALQHALEAVHSFTGLTWWTSIVLTTVLLRASVELVLLLLNRYDVHPLTPKVKARLKAFIPVPIYLSMFLAILDMVDKVPSLKTGGAYWFADLTTRDDTYILQALTTITLLAQTQFFMRHGKLENRTLQMLKAHGVLLLMITPFINFPKAVLLHFITCNLFSAGQCIALRYYYMNLPRVAPRPVPAQAQPPSCNHSGGTRSMPASDSPVAVKGSEQSSSEPSDLKVRGEPRK